MWWDDGIIYQIYPRSFEDSNDDGIGDINGITEKLDYLNDGTSKSLGVDAIWISPFFVSPMKDFGYDISNYRDVDPIFGTMEDFKILLAEAHKRNIHIIIDLVLNHTSDEHPWFKESKKDKVNSKADWYIWHKGINGKRPNNWFSQFELKNAWWYDSTRKEFYLGTFTRNQPELNWRNEDLRKEMFDTLRFWLEIGVDGFRLDVINWFIKDEQFRSNPYTLNSADFQNHIYDRNRPETIEICKEFRKITDSYPEKMMVGEVFTDNAKISASYYGGKNDGLHMAFNFNFLFQPWNAEKIYKSIINWYSNLPNDAWPNFTFSNHDNLRHILRYRRGKWTGARARVAASLILTLRGTPFIYYGEELGMTGGKLKRRDMKDPLSIKTWPLLKYRRDLARTPMQWDTRKNSGFSQVKPWLPVDENYLLNNVKLQEEMEDSLLNFYKKLIWERKSHTALQKGGIKFFKEYLPETLVYEREDETEKIYIFLNFTSKEVNIENMQIEKTNEEKLILGKSIALSTKIKLKPYETIIVAYLKN